MILPMEILKKRMALGLLALWVTVFNPCRLFAQDELLDQLEEEQDWKSDDALSTFKSVKLVNLETTEMLGKGVFYFGVAHRFGTLQRPIKDFFGLDNAITRLTFTYGIVDNWQAGASRSTFRKTYDIYSKEILVKQKEAGFPLTIALHQLLSIDTQFSEQSLPGLRFADRVALIGQLIAAHRFDSRFSALINASAIHENTVLYAPQENTQFVLGVGARYRLSKRSTVMAEYAGHLNRAEGSPYSNPFSIGWTIETGGHVFQLVLGNSQNMGERGVLTQTVGDWESGDIYFGFNLIRAFN